MSLERSPPAREALLARPIERATAWTLRFPYLTLAIAAAVAVAALAWAGLQLGYKTRRLDLLSPESDYNRLWLEYINKFGEEDDAVLVVEGASREQVVPILDELSERLTRDNRLFHGVLHQVDLSRLQAKGLHYLSPEQLQQIEQFVEAARPIVDGQWSRLSVAAMISDPAVAGGIERLSASLVAALRQRRYESPWPRIPDGLVTPLNSETGHLLAHDGRLGLVLLRLAPGDESFARCSQAIDALRELMAAVQERHPAVRIGLTGIPVLENDEMRSSSVDMFWASLLSLAGVSLLFVAGFGGWRHALLVNAVLLIGMAWSFGFVTLAVGHLNILSVSFTVTLIGIGIDYGIHYIARFLQLRHEQHECREALLATSRHIGPAIATCALTTAVAFFAAAFTSFTGIAELGTIAGGGILLCAAAQLFVLPAAVLAVDRAGWSARLPHPVRVQLWLSPMLKKPGVTLAGGLAITALLALGISRLWYDHNLLNLQADGLESVQLERKLVTDGKQSAWHALSICDSRDELLARKEQFQRLPSVERTEEIVALLPADGELKQPVIQRIGQRLAGLPEEAPTIPVDRPEDLVTTFDGATQLAQARELLLRLPPAEYYAALSELQQQMADDLLARLRALASMVDPQPPQWSDLPAGLVQRFVGKHNRHLLKVYARGDIWDPQTQARFVADVRSIDPGATGHPLQAYEASREMKRGYETAALYALAIILAVLICDFRNLRLALLAAAPLGLGVVQMFGLLGLLNIPLNPANLIALPLILGIGIDYGVHIVHEHAACQGHWRLSDSTAVAVLIDSFTTIVGFGSLMIASHQGLASLGRVLTLGVMCCLFTSLVMLPAGLTWLSDRWPESDDAPAVRDEAGRGLSRAA